MKILAINASHRGDRGYTRFLIDLLLEGAAEAGAQVETVSLAKLKINRCLACADCESKDHPRRCVYEGRDDVQRVFEKMAAADLIVYATPVYVFAMSGLLKTFLDRLYATADCRALRVTESSLMFHDVNADVCSKPFVTLVTCDNMETETPKNVLSYFRTFSRFMDAPQVGVLVRSGGLLTGYGRDPIKESRFPRIQTVYAAYRQAGRELALSGRIHPVTQRRANQEILPVPLFGLLKRLPFKALKAKFVERAQSW